MDKNIENEADNHLGKVIAAYRKKANMTQQELADKLGVNKGTIYQYEKGRLMPRYYRLREIVALLKIPEEAFAGYTEVKSIRAGTLNLKDAWCGIKDGQLLVNQMHISPYDHGNRFNVDSRRPRRLLMHKREIMRLYGKVKQDGFALIPLSVYFKGSRVKVKVGLCKGKKLHDKRQAEAERDAKRQIERAMKERY